MVPLFRSFRFRSRLNIISNESGVVKFFFEKPAFYPVCSGSEAMKAMPAAPGPAWVPTIGPMSIS